MHRRIFTPSNICSENKPSKNLRNFVATRGLGIEVPLGLLLAADEVIE